MNGAEDIINLVQESVVLRDLDGSITAWNAASEPLFGWSRGAAEGRPIHELLQTCRETIAVIEAGLRRDGFWEGEATRRRADGVHITVRLGCVRRGAGDIV